MTNLSTAHAADVNGSQTRGSGHRGAQAAARVGALLGALAVAGVTFALSFAGLHHYGRIVARMNPVLACGVPIGVDVMSIVAIIATFALRHAPWRVRAYAWVSFAVPTCASIAGNLSHGAALGLGWQGMIGVAIWPVLMAITIHLAIIVWRHADTAPGRQPDDDVDQPARTVARVDAGGGPVDDVDAGADTAADHTTDDTTRPPETAVDATGTHTPAPRPDDAPTAILGGASGTPDDTPDATTDDSDDTAAADAAARDRARALWATGKHTRPEIAAQLDQPLRNVQRWTQGQPKGRGRRTRTGTGRRTRERTLTAA